MNLTHLDAAMAEHLQHAAMPCADPLVDALYSQLEAPAAEGALPPGTAGTGLTPEQLAALAAAGDDPVLDALLPLAVCLGAVVSYWARWGFALPT